MRNALFYLASPLLLAAALSSPASAQWTQVPNIPTTNVFSLFSNADTIVAGTDTVAFITTDHGLHWKKSTRPAKDVAAITAVRLLAGRLYAGTFGQGVFISDDLGDTWQPFNQGLVGGFLDSQLDLSDLLVRGDSLYAATEGAGMYVRGFAPGSTWHHFESIFESLQASNVAELALGGGRLLASAGDNGTVFRRDPGDAEWTVSFLGNTGIHPSWHAQCAIATRTGWVVATNVGTFRSGAGQEPWTPSGPGLGSINNTALATTGHRIFAAFDKNNFAFMMTSADDGVSWQLLEQLFPAFVFKLEVNGDLLYAARTDGLWIRSIATVSVASDGESAGRLNLAVVGAQPVRGDVRLRFELDEPGNAVLDVYDVTGRHVGERIEGSYGAGPNVISWSASALRPGVYAALLSAGGTQEVVRLVHVR